MEKTCSKCKETKPTTDYHRCYDGYRPRCKECRKQDLDQERLNKVLDHWVVYETSSGHIGQTNNLYVRISKHKHLGKMKTREDITIIERVETKLEALQKEAYYQDKSPNYDKPDHPKHLLTN